MVLEGQSFPAGATSPFWGILNRWTDCLRPRTVLDDGMMFGRFLSPSEREQRPPSYSKVATDTLACRDFAWWSGPRMMGNHSLQGKVDQRQTNEERGG